MKTTYQLIPVLLIYMMATVSCNKYLDVQPKGVQLLVTANDYDQWLNSTATESSITRSVNLLADNADNILIPSPPVSAADLVYTWAPQFSQDPTTTPLMWTSQYASIYYFNAVISGIDSAAGGTPQQKASLKAEALLGRALDYLYLVNLYGAPYDAAKASSNWAVPFVTSGDIATPTPSRSTVQQIYDHIIGDILTAIPNLPADNSRNRFRGTVAAGYSVLSRTYLYMRNYAQAANYAQLALDKGPRSVANYNTMANSAGIGSLSVRPDAIYGRLGTPYTTTETPTLPFLKSFDTTDIRLKFFYINLLDYSFNVRGRTLYYPGGTNGSGYPNWGTSVAEMRLILAEASARSGNTAAALQQLDSVRKCRFPTARYKPYQSANADSVLQKVLQERTFEFPFNGMRWFDMRRLDADGKMQAVNRYDGTGNIIATLPPGSLKYSLQIPLQVLYFNPDWPQNPL